jgi:preprotein translocase subunit SecF
MAVDANIIIFERVKDEYRLGKSINASIAAGFKRALAAIIDSNVTTIIAAVILIALGTGSVRGFGLTWLIGVLISMFCSLVVTRGLLNTVLKINKTDAKLYNLKREDDVSEIPDDDNTKGSRPRGIFSLGKAVKNKFTRKKNTGSVNQ